MPRISIVIPVYNAQNSLADCLESIQKQSFSNYEIIAVNDGSTDQSAEILAGLSDKITIITQPNQGACVARNAGAKVARGEFLIFVDADVIMNPLMLEKMFLTLQNNPQAAFAYSDFIFGKKTFKLWPFDAEKLKQMPYIHTTSLIRQENFPGFDKALKRFQDWDLFLTMSERGFWGVYVPEVLFRVISGGTMSAWLPSFAYRFTFLPLVKKYLAAKEVIVKKHNLPIGK